MLRISSLCLFAALLTGCIQIDVHSKIIDEDTIKTDVLMVTNLLVAEQIKDSLKDEPIKIETDVRDDGQIELFFTMENFPFDTADWDCSGLLTTECTLNVQQTLNLPPSMTVLQTLAESKGGMSDEFEPTLFFTVEIPLTAVNLGNNSDAEEGRLYQWQVYLRKNNQLNAQMKMEM